MMESQDSGTSDDYSAMTTTYSNDGAAAAIIPADLDNINIDPDGVRQEN